MPIRVERMVRIMGKEIRIWSSAKSLTWWIGNGVGEIGQTHEITKPWLPHSRGYSCGYPGSSIVFGCGLDGSRVMEVGCYSIDLYCDCVSTEEYGKDCPHEIANYMYYPVQFNGHTQGQCRKQARSFGWVFKRDGRVISPHCKWAVTFRQPEE